MSPVRVEATVEADGELHLTALPYRRGDKVEAVVRELTLSSQTQSEREIARAAALDQFLELARTSSFRSAGAYPSRDDLHERA